MLYCEDEKISAFIQNANKIKQISLTEYFFGLLWHGKPMHMAEVLPNYGRQVLILKRGENDFIVGGADHGEIYRKDYEGRYFKDYATPDTACWFNKQFNDEYIEKAGLGVWVPKSFYDIPESVQPYWSFEERNEKTLGYIFYSFIVDNDVAVPVLDYVNKYGGLFITSRISHYVEIRTYNVSEPIHDVYPQISYKEYADKPLDAVIIKDEVQSWFNEC